MASKNPVSLTVKMQYPHQN